MDIYRERQFTIMRSNWVAERKNDPIRTQMHYARAGLVTGEMDYVAKRENVSAELIRGEVAQIGRAHV